MAAASGSPKRAPFRGSRGGGQRALEVILERRSAKALASSGALMADALGRLREPRSAKE